MRTLLGRIVIFCFLAALANAFGCSEDDENPQGPDGPPKVTIIASRDNTLYEDAGGTLSNGSGSFMFAGMTGTTNEPDPEIRRALVYFDVAASAMPGGSTVDSVSLVLSMSRTNSGPKRVSVYRVSSNWGEGSSAALGEEGGGDAAATGDATWIHAFYPADAWTSPGGDFLPTARDSVAVDQNGSYTWGSTPPMVADVQDWFDNPGNNFGWILVGDESGGTTAKRFNTHENPSSSTRPRLIVYYSAP